MADQNVVSVLVFEMESIEAICKDRRERTVKLMMDTEGRPYGRKDVLDGLLQAGVPRDSIEALGVRERNVDWEVTLSTASFSYRNWK